MGFLSGLALVLLSLVGYSSGAVLGARGRTPVPGIVDLVIVVVMWVVALWTRPFFGKWAAVGLWIVLGLILGAIVAAIRADSFAKAKAGQPPSSSAGFFGRIWQSWKGFSRRMGNYQSRVMMAFLYFTVVLPFGLGVTLLGDPLHIKRATKWADSTSTNWKQKQLPLNPSLEEAGRQF